MTGRRSGVSSLLPPNDDIPLSFSIISRSGSESIKYQAKKPKMDFQQIKDGLENAAIHDSQINCNDFALCVRSCFFFLFFFSVFFRYSTFLTGFGSQQNVISLTSLFHNTTMRTFSTLDDREHVSGMLRFSHSRCRQYELYSFFLFFFSISFVRSCQSTFYHLEHELCYTLI